MRRVLASIGLVAAASCVAADEPRLLWPLDLSRSGWLQSGAFADHRGNHLHGGVDLSTGGRVGVPVVAADAGAIVRVKVEWRGLGRAVYIDHAGGLQTVYGHLAGFAPPLRQWVDAQLASRGPYPGDLWPEQAFAVERGQVIGWSGETGGGPPHLHFETRRSGGTVVVDPFDEGLTCTDSVPPVIRELAVDDGDAISAALHGPRRLAPGGPTPIAVDAGVLVARIDDELGAGTGGVPSITVEVDGSLAWQRDAASFPLSAARKAGHVFRRDLTSTGRSESWYWLDDRAGPALPGSRGRFERIPFLEAGAQAVVRVTASDSCGNSTHADLRLEHGDSGFVHGSMPPACDLVESGRFGIEALGEHAWLILPQGALAKPQVLCETAVIDSELPRGVAIVGAPVRFGPEWLPLDAKADVVFVGDPRDRSLGMYRLDDGAWLYWGDDDGTGGSTQTVRAATDRLGTFALLRDRSPPRITGAAVRRVEGLPWRDDADELVVTYEEIGEGLDWDAARLELRGSIVVRGEVDPDRAEIVFALTASRRPRSGRVVLVDRSGLEGRKIVSLVKARPPATDAPEAGDRGRARRPAPR